MIAHTGNRSSETKKIMDELQSREWGLLILDEVHVVPADVFRRVLTVTAAHCKLGLTATLVREDEKIEDLNFLIGPKLYEANWIDLTNSGFIANVQCAEVWCPMTPDFYREYLICNDAKRRQLLFVMNPHKFQCCQFLIKYHEARGDKIIVFCDNIFALQNYAKKLEKPMIYGNISDSERMAILQQFQFNPGLKTIFLSRVGDNSIDLPAASVIIQYSSHFASRRQEAQRLGRILRPKARSETGYNAYFYSLISKDTEDMYYSTKRRQFLFNQGYSFKIISELPDMKKENLFFQKEEEQKALLQEVLAYQGETKENLASDSDDITLKKKKGPSVIGRIQGSLKKLSGGDGLTYVEYVAKKPGRKPK